MSQMTMNTSLVPLQGQWQYLQPGVGSQSFFVFSLPCVTWKVQQSTSFRRELMSFAEEINHARCFRFSAGLEIKI